MFSLVLHDYKSSTVHDKNYIMPLTGGAGGHSVRFLSGNLNIAMKYKELLLNAMREN